MTSAFLPPAPPENREQRLRSRIDFISDQRDAALEELWDAKNRVDDLEALNQKLRHDIRDIRKSREMWKERAVAAEAVARAHRLKGRGAA